VADRLDEIKQAITKQDMVDLQKTGAIIIKEIKGRKKNERQKRPRGQGNVKKNINLSKKRYIAITRKLRAFIKNLYSQEKISKERYYDLRKKIKMNMFSSQAQLKERVQKE
jgi:ribosomal protein L19E